MKHTEKEDEEELDPNDKFYVKKKILRDVKRQKEKLRNTVVENVHRTPDIDEITMNYVKKGKLLKKELKRHVIKRGFIYCVILFKFQAWSNERKEYSAPAYSIRGYKKYKGLWEPYCRLDFTKEENIKEMIETLGEWINE